MPNRRNGQQHQVVGVDKDDETKVTLYKFERKNKVVAAEGAILEVSLPQGLITAFLYQCIEAYARQPGLLAGAGENGVGKKQPIHRLMDNLKFYTEAPCRIQELHEFS